MSKHRKKCACGLEAYSKHANVGEAAKETGFMPVMLLDSTMIWLCPIHAREAMAHARKLVELVGSKWVVPPMLWDEEDE